MRHGGATESREGETARRQSVPNRVKVTRFRRSSVAQFRYVTFKSVEKRVRRSRRWTNHANHEQFSSRATR